MPTLLRSYAALLWLAMLASGLAQAQTAPGKATGATIGVKLSSEEIAAAGIELAAAGPGILARSTRVPGSILIDPDHIGHVPAKVIGIVTELKKRLGDAVAKGEIVAYLESREVADAKSEYLTANVNLELQLTLFDRERSLWEKKISAEQQFLRAENAFTGAKLRRDLARQKLSALGVEDTEIADLANQPGGNLRRYAIRSPIAGRVIERRVDLGAPVGGDQQEKELYVVADLSALWIELSVPPADLAFLREGESVTVRNNAKEASREAKIVFISPQLNKETRSARVVLSLANPDRDWRAGSFVTADLLLEREAVELLVPKAALQQVEARPTVFVRSPEGFEARGVRIGRDTEQAAEILGGLKAGEQIAVSNTFVLKSEIGKSEAAD
ncbi:MAG: efflux RND transporter periplasmic adaptor subunit [Nitrobacter sp.]